MLCANCSDVDLHAILRGDHEGIPLEDGAEVWITRTSDPAVVWSWDSQPGCEFCEFLSATRLEIPTPLSEPVVKPRFLQLDGGKSYFRDAEKELNDFAGGKRPPHINIVFASADGSYEQYEFSDPDFIVPFRPVADLSFASSRIHPPRVNEIPVWLELSVTKRQLQECLQQHACCQGKTDTNSNRLSRLRLINCSSRMVVEAPPEPRYVALSYRWGSNHAHITVQGDGMLPEELPSTIEDALRVTQSIGFEFCWIDAYCITQTDEVDFRHQVRQMHLIYRYAQVTIIAGGAMDAGSGLIGISKPRPSTQTRGRYDGLGLFTFSISPWQKFLYFDEWNTRGWTFQEGFFSQRRLVFTDEQVLFDCNEGVISEDLQHSQIQYVCSLEKWQLDAWKNSVYELITSYTQRNLTYDSDILNAFDGVLEEFGHQNPPIRSHWGVPLPRDESGYFNAMLIGLCWSHYVQSGGSYRRPGFPSWSWAGWGHGVGDVVYPLRMRPEASLAVAHGLIIQVELQDGLVQAWSTFEQASPSSTNRHLYSQRIHLSAPSLILKLRNEPFSRSAHSTRMVEAFERQNAYVVRNEEGDCWEGDADLDNPFKTIELLYHIDEDIEVRVCHAIYLFSVSGLDAPYVSHTKNTFALLLVSKINANWERVGLWTQSFPSKEEARVFETWLHEEATFQKRDFWIA
jgi:hypothetical protein